MAAKPQAKHWAAAWAWAWAWEAVHLLGCLLHLCPPSVVSVIDEQQDLTPEQYQGWVCGHHGSNPCIEVL